MVRLVAAFNKVKIKGIAKKILLNNTFVTSRWLSGEAHGASGAFSCGFNKVKKQGHCEDITVRL